MQSRAATLLLTGAVLTGLAASVPANAGFNVDVAFGGEIPIDDDNRLYVSINSRYYDREPAYVETWSPRFRSPDDLQVFLFMTNRCKASPQSIYDMRRKGMTWFAISQRVHVPLDAFYVRIDGPAYPPFDRVYVQYDQWRQNPKKYRMSLSDGDIRNLVVMRTMSDYYRIPPGQAMKMRASGKDCRYLMAQEYRRRHGKDVASNRGNQNSQGNHKDSDRDHDQGHGNDHKDHGHGNGNGHGNDKKNDHGHDK